MFAELLLAATLATPNPASIPSPTPPPEPNHVTLAGTGSYLWASGDNWQNWHGFISQAWGLYEFQASPTLRFSDEFHWERLSSNFDVTFRGATFNSPFNFDEYDDEFDVELGKAQLPTGVGVGYYDYSPVYDFTPYHLSGFGFGVDHWSNWYVITSPFYNVWYFPNLTSASPTNKAYGILRADVGVNIRKSLVSPWGVQFGLEDEDWFGHNANSAHLNFLSPYVSITWWQ
jgi:hypothetical protein